MVRGPYTNRRQGVARITLAVGRHRFRCRSRVRVCFSTMLVNAVSRAEPLAVEMRLDIMLVTILGRTPAVRMRHCCQLTGKQTGDHKNGNTATKHRIRQTSQRSLYAPAGMAAIRNCLGARLDRPTLIASPKNVCLADTTGCTKRKTENRHEDSSVRGARLSATKPADNPVNAPRRERELPAFRVLRQFWQ